MMDNIFRIFASAEDIVGGAVDNANKTDLSVEGIVVTVIRVALWVIGLLAVAFIIYGGIKYTMSGGESAKVKAAKDTIMYAVIGLIVAILAYAIVGFVVNIVGTDEGGGGGGGGSGGGALNPGRPNVPVEK